MHPNTFEQLRVFREVAATGSFSEAAQNLGKAVSAVSYAVSNLEGQFDLLLFDRTGYRPVLTLAGKTLYKDTLILFRRLERFQARVDTLKDEDSVVLTLGHDILVPSNVLAKAVSQLSREVPHVDVRLQKIGQDQIGPLLRSKKVDLAIISLADNLQFDGVDGKQIGSSEAIIVSSPDHPLAHLNHFTLADLDRFRQLLLIDQVPEPGEETYFIHSNDYWTCDDLDMFRELLKNGQVWAWVHRDQVIDLLQNGVLMELNTPDVREFNRRRFAVTWPVKKPGGSTVRRFVDLLAKAFEMTS